MPNVTAEAAARPQRWVFFELQPHVAPVLATAVTAVVLGGFLVMALVYAVIEDPSPTRVVPAAVALLVLFGLQIGVIGNPARDPSRPAGVAALLGEVAIAGLAVEFGYGWLGLLGFVAGSVLLVLRGRMRWPLFVLVSLVNSVLTAFLPDSDPLLLIYTGLQTVGTGLTVYGLTRLRQTAVELHATRGDAGELAAARERLRLARDLHDTTGSRLSAIVLRAQLARRLLDTDPHRSASELATVVSTARGALDEVRTTARHYHAPRLADEIAAARSTLQAAGVATDIVVDGSEIPPDVGRIVVSVLRASVDDVIAAPGVQSCTITLTRAADRVELWVDDDRDNTSEAFGDSALAAAVAAAGGSLTAGREAEGDGSSGAWGHAVRAVVPAPAPAAGAPVALASRRLGWIAARQPLAAAILAAALVGYALNSIQFVLYLGAGVGVTVLASAAVGVMLALLLGVVCRRRERSGRRLAALAVLAVLSAGSILILADPYVGLPGFVAGSVLLVLSRRARWIVFAAVVAASTVAQAVLNGTPDGIAYGFVATVNHGLVVYGLTRLRDLVGAVEAARDDVAALAVARERLRFARDLHDLLGYGLSAITLKSELAARLAVSDPIRARSELDDVLNVAGQALTDVRSVAGHQLPLDLAAEIASIRSVLEAADIVPDLDTLPDLSAVPTTPATLLATVLREAVTNMLRHSDLTHAKITLDAVGPDLRLDIVNDGAPETSSEPPGTGLSSLAARAAALGGALVSGLEEADRFAVRVTVPAGCDERFGGHSAHDLAPAVLAAAGASETTSEARLFQD